MLNWLNRRRVLLLALLVVCGASRASLAQSYGHDYSGVVYSEGVYPATAYSEASPPGVIDHGQGGFGGVHEYSISPSSQPIVSRVDDGAGSKQRATRLHETLLNAKNNLDVGRRPKFAEVQAKLKQALESLERYVGPGTKNGENWSQFLRVPDIRRLVDFPQERLNPERVPAMMRLAQELEMNMRQNYLGLEYPQFTRLRDALNEFCHASRFFQADQEFDDEVLGTLNLAIEMLESGKIEDSELEFRLGNVLFDLHQGNQTPNALQHLRSSFSRPNVRLIVDGRLVNRLVSRPVSQPSPVCDNILGTEIVGDAFLGGNVSSQLIPMSGGIGLQLNLNASMCSQTLGFNRGVVITASSSSPVWASKQIFVTNQGISTSAPSVATALQSSIEHIDHHLRIVQKIAGRRAAQMKPQADSIAEGKLQDRVGTQFSQQVDEQVAQAQTQLTQFRQQPLPELKRVGIERPELSFYSTSSEVHASTTQAASDQLAAPGPCPLPRPTSALVVGQLHQSALNNALETILAGRVIRNKELGGYARQILGHVPEAIHKETQEDEWSMTFSTYRPVWIEFKDGLIKITLRLDRSERGRDRVTKPFSVSVSYLPQCSDNQLTLTRQEDVLVMSDETGLRATAMRAFLKTKFDASFQKSIVTEPLDLHQFPQLQNLQLNLSQLAIALDKGWLQVAIP